ncbi:hypothetical protein F2Q70_00016428 [Brassica cretica]|uniref:Uncharacterized protein n=1 Tax=Brassica cretica TaxID=69181 RepID=A0A8S9I2Z7_BRACR|nr:hypothetical protein F2Q70_00016428 [Brassica cretica]
MVSLTVYRFRNSFDLHPHNLELSLCSLSRFLLLDCFFLSKVKKTMPAHEFVITTSHPLAYHSETLRFIISSDFLGLRLGLDSFV